MCQSTDVDILFVADITIELERVKSFDFYFILDHVDHLRRLFRKKCSRYANGKIEIEATETKSYPRRVDSRLITSSAVFSKWLAADERAFLSK